LKDIIVLKQQIEKKLAREYCKVNDIQQCPNRADGCTCAIAAEVQAYLRSIIPAPYYKFSIYDFNGMRDGTLEQVIDTDSAIIAKQKVVEFCWKNLDLKKLTDLKPEELDNLSIINKRRRDGTNVVVFADTDMVANPPKGKTFCAALILKEAIKHRASIGADRSETYDWIEFSILNHMIRSDDDGLANIRNADWLVIDNIPRNTKPGWRQCIDPFLMGRISDGLPTIFVCRFDVRKGNGEMLSGMGLSKVFTDPKTFFIPLQKLENLNND